MALVFLLHATAAAQVGGTVTGPDGRPVPAATVELWGAGERLGLATTDAEGRFAFPADLAAGAKSVSFQRIGYAPLTRGVAPPAELAVRLEPLAVSLPELRSGNARKACPNREDPEARRLWEAGRRGYDAGGAGRGFTYAGTSFAGTVDPRDVGVVDESRFHHLSAGWSARYGGIDSLVREQGYAVRKNSSHRWGTAFDGDFFEWVYLSLHERHAHHFAGDAFGALHTLSIFSRSGGETTLAFCPRDPKRPSAQGTLDIGADTSFLSAAWSFHTPKPREGAGGEVVFAPRSETPRPLHAVRGIFWRRLGGSRRYWQRATTYTTWIVGEDTAMPVKPWPRRPTS